MHQRPSTLRLGDFLTLGKGTYGAAENDDKVQAVWDDKKVLVGSYRPCMPLHCKAWEVVELGPRMAAYSPLSAADRGTSRAAENPKPPAVN